MALKILTLNFPGSNGLLFTNSSACIILIISISATYSGSGTGVVYVADPSGSAVGELVKVYGFAESLGVSGSNTFSSTATSTTGITDTTEDVNEEIGGLTNYLVQVVNKCLMGQGFSIVASSNMAVYGLLAIQADSLEELRGFL